MWVCEEIASEGYRAAGRKEKAVGGSPGKPGGGRGGRSVAGGGAVRKRRRSGVAKRAEEEWCNGSSLHEAGGDRERQAKATEAEFRNGDGAGKNKAARRGCRADGAWGQMKMGDATGNGRR